ncbi:MAG: response regulator transcription factor [Bacteroidetes bacterium]|nr:response regulator transcription factor [Fibrella sp.]
MLTAIAIDDEPIALDVIRFHANKVPFLYLKQTFVNAIEALSYLRTEPVDLVFLDVNMPDLTGLDVARLLPPTTMVIFSTAYAEHAVKGFELNAVDYLVKPVDFGRFLQACNRANERRQSLANPTDDRKRSPAERDAVSRDPVLFVKDGYDYVRIALDDLLYIESEGNYLTFYETGKKVVTRMTVAEAMTQLPGPGFMRIHKSYIVSLTHIDKIERHQVTIGKTQIPLAGTYRDELLERVK